jgi:DNA (cytosine-5)-methyltransferase 1
MRVLSLFSGIGAFEKALSNLFIDYEVVNYCEIDKYARKAYSLLHNISEDKNLIDVTQVKTRNLQDIDLITYGFPCQDISNAGYQKGFTDNNGNRTRS